MKKHNIHQSISNVFVTYFCMKVFQFFYSTINKVNEGMDVFIMTLLNDLIYFLVFTLQQKVSLYAKWFHWILSDFIGLVNKD